LKSSPTPELFFSIVVPAYNASQFIEETLISLLDQTFRDYEIIVIDDGSTDDTSLKLRRFADRITVVTQSNQGSEAARNAGIDRARGKYVVSFDADDVLFPHALEVYAETIANFDHPPVILAMVGYFGLGTPVPKSNWDGITVRCTESSCFFRKRDSVSVFGSNIIARRDMLIKVNGFQLNSYCDDRCLLFRLGTESPFIVIEYPATVAYRNHAASISKNLDFMIRAAAAICGSERGGLYPGGRPMRIDRRGLIASNVVSNIPRLILRLASVSKWEKGKAIVRILLKVRLFLFSGIIRLVRKRGYPKKEHEFMLTSQQRA
jgi:glycosyltransferase involved in cell wall biosynthesis